MPKGGVLAMISSVSLYMCTSDDIIRKIARWLLYGL